MDTEMTKLWTSAALALMTTSSQASEVFRFWIHSGTARIEIRAHCRDLSWLNLSFGGRDSKTVTSMDFGSRDGEAEFILQPVASPLRTTDALSGPAATAAANVSADADAAAKGR
jgi:hypothetical protein